jgi:hypothetical protein
VGVLDGAEYSEPEVGTAQGSVRTPLLGNVYRHYGLDLWFAQVVKGRLRGKAMLLRYADDFLIGFEQRDSHSAHREQLFGEFSVRDFAGLGDRARG